MPVDALWPGKNGEYPNFPRHADGSPAWSYSPETDGVPVVGPNGVVTAPMPRGIRHIVRGGQRIATDMTPTDINGNPIYVPTLETTL